MSSAALLDVLGTYLDQAAFSDANASGGNLVIGRQVLSDFDATIAEAGKTYKQSGVADEDQMMTDSNSLPAIADEDVRRQALEIALEKVQPRVLSFEEQASSIRQHLADLLEESEDWLEAARILQGIPLDSGHRSVSDLAKLRTYVRIVRLLLEGDDAVGADAVLKRASLIIHNVPGALSSGLAASSTTAQQEVLAGMSEAEKTEAKTLGLQYKLSQARIYDSQRRFAEAANRYHEVSYVAEIDEGERNMMLSAAVTASILAPAGPQRSRILATLIRDERTVSLPQHTILTKTFLDQFIRPNEIKSFEKLLGPHQLAALPRSEAEPDRSVKLGGGEDAEMGNGDDEEESARTGPSTVLDRAMMEHNIIAASRLYTNITLRGLGSLLDVHSSGAETMARRMIVQGRLKAEIDQVDQLVIFGEQKAREVGVVGGVGSAVAQKDNEQAQLGREDAEHDDPTMMYTKRWDASIAKTASGVEEVCARLRARGYMRV